MLKKKRSVLLALLLVLAFFLSACNPPQPPPPQPIEPDPPIEEPKEEEPSVEDEKENEKEEEEPEEKPGNNNVHSPFDEEIVLREPVGLPRKAPVDDSYFDDVVIIGDSVTLKLYYYVLNYWNYDEDFLGGIQFLTAGSLGSDNALWVVSDESVHPLYQGKKMLLEDSISLSKAKKVYIMLGTNDIGIFGPEGAVENLEELISRISAKTPDLEFFLQSVLPMYSHAQLEYLNNKSIAEYNKAVYKMSQRLGHYYVDVSSVMETAEGNLPYQYCSDPDSMGIHLTDIACDEWISFLRHHTP